MGEKAAKHVFYKAHSTFNARECYGNNVMR
jgi:hypothetical protein